ncbi:hypothetical protein F2Q70_00023550 [Brassica cretica]|uniref:Ubiquitin-like domain-containing protein n=1 Tax=Brassica cretica TaxID=69181 RepID=A0A8S9GNG5_BRACR|nr:hypothetical protein F2Q70_00023550 [Brassica cretica]
MVFKRKLDCVSVAFDYPNIPRAPRSCRRKVQNKRIDDDDDAQMCAMDLLASLAGKILEEGQSSSASSNAFEGNAHENFGKEVKTEREDHDKPLKSESSDQGNSVSMPTHGNHTNLVRDDDEKLYSSRKCSNKFTSYKSPAIRRIRKSKYSKQVSKDFGHYRADVGIKALYRKRKSCYGYNAWKHETIYKRRRSPDRSSVVTSDGGLSNGSVSKLPEKRKSVKLSIKSFRIPELFIEVPETATVGSLKRTVMEAVSVLLSGGIRVGVLVHGKKVRDDKRTLSQTGISSEENLTNLGFTLEPGGTSKVPIPLCSDDPVVPPTPTEPTSLCERY